MNLEKLCGWEAGFQDHRPSQKQLPKINWLQHGSWKDRRRNTRHPLNLLKPGEIFLHGDFFQNYPVLIAAPLLDRILSYAKK